MVLIINRLNLSDELIGFSNLNYGKYEETIFLEDMTGIFQPMLRCKNPWLAMTSRGFCALPRLKTPLVRYFSLIISPYLIQVAICGNFLFFGRLLRWVLRVL